MASRNGVPLIVALVLSVAISLYFVWLDFPAAWLTGGVFGAAVAVICRQHFRLPASSVNISYIILGALFGSAIRPSIADEFVAWSGTLALSCLSLVIIMVASTWYMKRVEGWDYRTSFFATAPGALPAVIALAAEYSVDQKRIALSQTVRLVSFVAIVPLLSSGAANSVPSAGTAPMDVMGLAVVLSVAAAGGIAGQFVRLPGGLMVGALIAVGTLYALGGAKGDLPVLVQNPAMLIMGMFIGMQLSQLAWVDFLASFRAVIAVLILGSVVALFFAFVAAFLASLPFLQVLLAFLPGAMEGMTLMGFILGLDPAFISLHHIVRFLFVVLALPVVSRGWDRPA